MKLPVKSLSAMFALLFAAAPLAAYAQTGNVRNQTGHTLLPAQNGYWTPERFKAAKPLPMPAMAPGSVKYGNDGPLLRTGLPSGRDGVPPRQEYAASEMRLFTPDSELQAMPREASVDPSASGSFNSPYTSSRVFPMYVGKYEVASADRSFPYRAVGKLFFSINGSPYLCSASVIFERVIATAGHCVHSGDNTNSGFYSNFVFVPAYRDGKAPYLAWTGTAIQVSFPWYSGGGVVPNAADYALIAVADQPMTSGGPPVKLGNVVGMLGYQLFSLDGNHTSKLGYPCNLDVCEKMQIVTSSSLRTVAPNNVEYGSDAEGGSSGGPWVQSFQVPAAGGGKGSNVGKNRIVGITSYGYVPNTPKVQGASVLGDDWILLLKGICIQDPGNCQ